LINSSRVAMRSKGVTRKKLKEKKKEEEVREDGGGER